MARLWASRREKRRDGDDTNHSTAISLDLSVDGNKRPRWSMGILNDDAADEVPGSVLLLPEPADHNEPLGLSCIPPRSAASSFPLPDRPLDRERQLKEKKRTKDGKINLEPQPDDNPNDPLNWSVWRRNAALLSLGLYCFVGGGMSTLLAAGFPELASTYDISIPRVSLSTGLYMAGLGVGSVFVAPTAILWGKRPVYLASCVVFILASVWCALSPNYGSLLGARVVQGIAVSPVECLPSVTIAEVHFLHDRAYRLGLYTLLLFGGSNLAPLASAAIISRLGWRWVFWILTMIVGFCGCLLFFFVPETFWDRTRRLSIPNIEVRKASDTTLQESLTSEPHKNVEDEDAKPSPPEPSAKTPEMGRSISGSLAKRRQMKMVALPEEGDQAEKSRRSSDSLGKSSLDEKDGPLSPVTPKKLKHPMKLLLPGPHPIFLNGQTPTPEYDSPTEPSRRQSERDDRFLIEVLQEESLPTKTLKKSSAPPTPELRNLNSPWYAEKVASDVDYFSIGTPGAIESVVVGEEVEESPAEGSAAPELPPIHLQPPLRLEIRRPKSSKAIERATQQPDEEDSPTDAGNRGMTLMECLALDVETALPPIDSQAYTHRYRSLTRQSFRQSLAPYNGRLSKSPWLQVAVRPFFLFAYPAILWSSLVYALSVGWLVVLSESVAVIYRSPERYSFSVLQTGLIYASPLVGGILGTVVAGKGSDLIVRWMARRNGGVYEPEFRLVMVIPIAISSALGLMGIGWSSEVGDAWIVPTVFFGVVGFGCSLGSTTAITFAVDSYRQYAGEALVTMNLSKNILHGLVFSLFFTSWLESSSLKTVFLVVGGIQLGCLLLTIPMYIYGKRARMCTVRRNLIERR